FQVDKPFDEFVREQIAGDLLAAGTIDQRQDQLTATGFLVLGNVNIFEADKLIMRMDLADQQVEKLGKTFLGMTLNCARCHDHKFDPVTDEDFYALYGVFARTRPVMSILDDPKRTPTKTLNSRASRMNCAMRWPRAGAKTSSRP